MIEPDKRVLHVREIDAEAELMLSDRIWLDMENEFGVFFQTGCKWMFMSFAVQQIAVDCVQSLLSIVVDRNIENLEVTTSSKVVFLGFHFID